MKTFCLGDIHGAYKPLQECLALARFDASTDRLICLGDVCDRGPKVRECIDELLKIPNCIYILGNHDAWGLEWMISNQARPEWKEQGGAETIKSYKKKGVPVEHIDFLTKARLYYVDQNRLFVHGGFDPSQPIENNPKEILLWDRSLLKRAQEMQLIDSAYKFGSFDEVYVGHTPTLNFASAQPRQFCNVWAMDTGAGWKAKLTIMDINTKQYWQADV